MSVMLTNGKHLRAKRLVRIQTVAQSTSGFAGGCFAAAQHDGRRRAEMQPHRNMLESCSGTPSSFAGFAQLGESGNNLLTATFIVRRITCKTSDIFLDAFRLARSRLFASGMTAAAWCFPAELRRFGRFG